ncbi:MAG: potassium-transporting ATPase subunit KdpA [Phycisphaerae bacterium]|nr:potassium-transporting ATPase subunit KdpA [Phycisphaerae bacterium]
MTPNAWLQIALLIGTVLLLVKPVGTHMAHVYENQPVPGLGKVLGPVERGMYRLCGISANHQQDWKSYTVALLLFNMLGFLAVYFIQRWQGWLPLNPAHMPGVTPSALAFNTAASFITNTDWQNYAGESTMSYFTQMAALTVQNFLSAATGLTVLVALVRGLARKTTTELGSFWVDLTRSVLYILLPLSLILAIALIWHGVPQTLEQYITVHLVQPFHQAGGTASARSTTITTQTIAIGPVASQEAIKELGTNGGGFFDANSAHPFENPTGLTNFLEELAILLLPLAFCYTFGRMVGDTRQGWAVLAAMVILLVALMIPCVMAEQAGNPLLAKFCNQRPTPLQPGGNMVGKESRFGPVNSAIFNTVATGTSTGAVNAMTDSFTPLGGLCPLWLMQLSEVAPGGVGSGLYGMLMFVLITVFIAGLMIGRTPEYLGKKIEAFEMKMASVAILVPPALALVGTAIACVTAAGLAGIANPQAHGFSEMLYAMTSQSNNNGSAFAGLSGDTTFYNLLGGLLMLATRFWTIIPTMAIAGSLARKKIIPAGSGTLSTYSPLFVFILLAIIVVVVALTFFPALALGPIVEQLQMMAGHW